MGTGRLDLGLGCCTCESWGRVCHILGQRVDGRSGYPVPTQSLQMALLWVTAALVSRRHNCLYLIWVEDRNRSWRNRNLFYDLCIVRGHLFYHQSPAICATILTDRRRSWSRWNFENVSDNLYQFSYSIYSLKNHLPNSIHLSEIWMHFYCISLNFNSLVR